MFALECPLLAEQLAACRLAGIPPPARLRRALRALHRQALWAPAARLSCDAGACLGQLAALLGEVCPMPPGCLEADAPAGLCIGAAPGELGRLLLWLIGSLFPAASGGRVQLSARQSGQQILVCLQLDAPRQKIPPRSVTRQANVWARQRGGWFFWIQSCSSLCAVLALPPGQTALLRPPRYALWAFDRCSPVYSLLPLRLILPG